MSIEILQPGLFTTIQDLGRYGYQKQGVIVSGAMDGLALRIANLLVGNKQDEAGLELTWRGPEIYFTEDHLIVITGANFTPTIQGKVLQPWRPVWVKKGNILKFESPVSGYWSYVAFSGSFNIPEVMGSKSTYLKSKLGGLHGRTLQSGDIISCKGPVQKVTSIIGGLKNIIHTDSFAQTRWSLNPSFYPTFKPDHIIRAITGPHYDWFTDESKYKIWNEPFQVTHLSDRMGYRLKGPSLFLTTKRELLSSAVSFGTIQVPADGNPIVLMADHQTTGGYPIIAQVASADSSRLAQIRPGNEVNFQQISLQEAQHLFIEQEQRLSYIKRAIQIKLK